MRHLQLALAVLVAITAADCTDHTLIAFESDRSGHNQIYTIRPDGSELTQRTSGPLVNWQAALSVSNVRLAYRSQVALDKPSSLWVMLTTGGPSTQLTPAGLDSAGGRWSPGTTEIAFSAVPSGSNDGPDIYLIWNNGTNLKRLTTDPGNDVEPSFSPDGTKILFTSTRNGNSDIWIMNVDGTGQTRLTSDPAPDAQASFNSDGTKIAFWSRRTGNGDIYLMNPDGSGLVNLTNSPAVEFEPVFAPYSNKIAFSSDRDGNSEIYIIDVATKAVTRLTNDPAVDRAPDWK